MRTYRMSSHGDEFVDALHELPTRTTHSLVRAAHAMRESSWWTSIPSDPEVRCHAVGRAVVEHGEDLPGSWHQQSNGGARAWSTMAGEFEAR